MARQLNFKQIIGLWNPKHTLRSLINVESVINVQGDKFSTKNKRTGRKSSSISQGLLKDGQESFSKIYKLFF